MFSGRSGQALVLVLLMTTFIFLVGGAALALSLPARRNAALDVFQKKAYYIAEAGVEKALEYINTHREWLQSLPVNQRQPVPLSELPLMDYYDGTLKEVYITKLRDMPAAAIRIESKGRFESATKKITVEGLLTSPANLLRGLAVLQPEESSFDFKGSFNFNGVGSDLPRASIIWNGEVSFGNGTTLKNVDVFASGNIRDLGGNKSEDVNSNPNYPYIPDFPQIDIDWYRNVADSCYYEDKTLRLNNTHCNGVIFIDGNLIISGTYTGRAIIVVTGNIIIDGELTGGSNDILVLMAPNGKVTLDTQGNNEIHAFIIAGITVSDLKGKQEVKGGILTRHFSFQGEGSGNVTITAEIEKLQSLLNETDFLNGFKNTVKVISWNEGAG
ncbi:pilus assembly PilX N-terminal domain-containing protein [Desulfofundulus thermocisternus]|uniref:pilus assembly PilX N-terminal domain-containing protein n=1 Tax=Desulfofundulus thermocisternus TaxID=42471 RepID=UPI0004823D06|nr:pilus assembly PilX N-terminal domain-containing protein [Desulfofundulus thermocisternus]